MTSNDFYEYTRNQPFIPFRVDVTDGRTYSVRHPDQILVLPSAVHVLVPDHSPDESNSQRLSMRHIVRLQPLDSDGVDVARISEE